MTAHYRPFLALVAALCLPGPTLAQADAPAVIIEPPAPPTAEELPLDDLRILVEVFHKIKRDYVEQVDDKTLLENAMRGMLAGLDPHSAFLDPEEYNILQEGTTGEFGGLGIEVGVEDGFIKVISPIDDTPAKEAGVQAGDVIVRLDDMPVKGMALNDAVERMRGDPGTKIVLTVLRDGEEKPVKIEIVRAIITVQSVKSRMLEPKFAYVRLSNFQARTGDDARKHVRRLLKEAGGRLDGLVLDLRNNPGGILGAAVTVSDLFLESGRVVYTEGRVEDSQLEFEAEPPDLLNGAPMVVLVNEGSASASEIVAGALQDQRRAVIMGRRTFGKGSVQTILPMNNEAALKLTTARYFTPAGRSIQAEGIVPDIVIDKVKLQAIALAEDNIVKEASLARHLSNPVNGETEEAEEEAAEADDFVPAPTETRQQLAESDYELYEALNLLKGMALLQARSSID